VAVDTAFVDSGWVVADTTGSTSEDRVFQGVRRSYSAENPVHGENRAAFPWPSGGMEVKETAAVASEDLGSAGGKRSQDVKTLSAAGAVERDMWDCFGAELVEDQRGSNPLLPYCFFLDVV
jgi:hypothetical protein